MKHIHIAKTLGWTEVPETTEGVFLQPEEAVAIDSALGTITAAEETAGQLVAANATIETLNTTVTSLQAAATTANETINTHTATIAALEAKVAELGGQPSGTGTVIKATEEATSEDSDKLPRYDSADHPGNRAAARWIKKA